MLIKCVGKRYSANSNFNNETDMGYVIAVCGLLSSEEAYALQVCHL